MKQNPCIGMGKLSTSSCISHHTASTDDLKQFL